MTELNRIRTEADGSETAFREAAYGGQYPYRAEVACRSIDEVRQFARSRRLIALRMVEVDVEAGRRPQINLVSHRQIQGL